MSSVVHLVLSSSLFAFYLNGICSSPRISVTFVACHGLALAELAALHLPVWYYVIQCFRPHLFLIDMITYRISEQQSEYCKVLIPR